MLDLGGQNIGDIVSVDLGFATKQSLAGKLGSVMGKDWLPSFVEARAPPASVFISCCRRRRR
jgi:hypothetical protein